MGGAVKHRNHGRHADFIGIPRKVADSAAFRCLPALARALYVDLRRQHNGHNNGAIAAVDEGTDDRPGLTYYGWAHSTVHKLLRLLLEHGLIEKTRQGGIGAMSKTCTLYGFTDLAIVANKEKGIAGRMASLAYLEFDAKLASEKQMQGPQREPKGSHGGLVKVHGVTATGREGPHRELCVFPKKAA